MQPWLQPTQASTSSPRPLAAFSTSSGSAISARVIPTASAAPDSTSRSAALRSTTRVVAISGTSTAARTAASASPIAASGAGGGGAIQLEAAT
jgi:hypothetical protein